MSPLGREQAAYNPNDVQPPEEYILDEFGNPILDENGNPIVSGSAINIPGVVTGGAIDPMYLDPLYTDPETVGGGGTDNPPDGNVDNPPDGGNETPPDGGETSPDSTGESSGEGGETAGTDPNDPDVNVWDDNYLSEDPNF